MKFLAMLSLTVFLTISSQADPYPRQSLDVQHYRFQVELNDSTNVIRGEARVSILFRKSTDTFTLDLGSREGSVAGMTVSSVQLNNQSLTFTHSNGKLTITLPAPAPAGETRVVVITYSGVPEDGFIISKNKFGDRTFFADHWPDRGHLWLPCIDHPSDKATVEFAIIAPEHYEVVASGLLVEESDLDKGRKLTRYREQVPIPTKVMAVGVARFAMEVSGVVDGIPQSTWVYPQNRENGFGDFKVSVNVFEFFQKSIGPYSYEKLAHVQSKTRWGGLENAGNIFYTERSVTGKKTIEKLIAHETAHQWFGNSVAESDWHHVWVSEGFATYFALLYLEHTYGADRMRADLAEDRNKVIQYFEKNPRPVVDTTITEIGKVLNTNTYQKASWVLHMLRQHIGDDAFWKGIQTYYRTYRNGHALTPDFQRVMESVSGKDLSGFFNQWFYRGGHPRISLSWSYSQARGELQIKVKQEQPMPFDFPLDLRVELASGPPVEQTLPVSSAQQQFTIKVSSKPTGVVLDPGCRLLFEGSAKGR